MIRDVRIDVEAFEEFLKQEKLLRRNEYILSIRLEVPLKGNEGTNVAIRASND